MTDATIDTLYCANHPNVATSLRCNKCGKPICARCAVRTPVGYRCKDCTRAQQQIFETVVWYDYLSAALIAAVLGGLGSLTSGLVFWLLFIAPAVGGVIAEVIRYAVRRRRGRYLSWVAVGGFVAGCLPAVLGLLVQLFGRGLNPWGFLGLGLYLFLGAGALYARMRGISI
jgi:hypothetical protein